MWSAGMTPAVTSSGPNRLTLTVTGDRPADRTSSDSAGRQNGVVRGVHTAWPTSTGPMRTAPSATSRRSTSDTGVSSIGPNRAARRRYVPAGSVRFATWTPAPSGTTEGPRFATTSSDVSVRTNRVSLSAARTMLGRFAHVRAATRPTAATPTASRLPNRRAAWLALGGRTASTTKTAATCRYRGASNPYDDRGRPRQRADAGG